MNHKKELLRNLWEQHARSFKGARNETRRAFRAQGLGAVHTNISARRAQYPLNEGIYTLNPIIKAPII